MRRQSSRATCSRSPSRRPRPRTCGSRAFKISWATGLPQSRRRAFSHAGIPIWKSLQMRAATGRRRIRSPSRAATRNGTLSSVPSSRSTACPTTTTSTSRKTGPIACGRSTTASTGILGSRTWKRARMPRSPLPSSTISCSCSACIRGRASPCLATSATCSRTASGSVLSRIRMTSRWKATRPGSISKRCARPTKTPRGKILRPCCRARCSTVCANGSAAVRRATSTRARARSTMPAPRCSLLSGMSFPPASTTSANSPG
nr:putative terpene synthase [uncultured microorganism]